MIRRRSPHLGDRAAALVDGELGHDDRDRAFAHIARCVDCREEVAAQRRLKGRLRGLVDPPVDPRLLALVAAAGERGNAVPPTPPRGHRARHPVRLAATSCLTVAAATVGAAFAVGGGSDVPTVNPPIDRFVVEHVATTDELPLNDPDVGAAAVTLSRNAPP